MCAARSGLCLLLLVLLPCDGCFGGRYERVMSVHLELMQSLADKMCAMAQDGVPPPAQSMGEFLYPATRAQQFAEYHSDNAERRSYRLFVRALERYEATVHLVDRSRSDPGEWRARGDEVCAGRDAVRAAAEEARLAVERGE